MTSTRKALLMIGGVAVGVPAFVAILYATSPATNADEAARAACAEFYEGLRAITEGRDGDAHQEFLQAHVFAKQSKKPPNLESHLFQLNNMVAGFLDKLGNPDPGDISLQGMPPGAQAIPLKLADVDNTCTRARAAPK